MLGITVAAIGASIIKMAEAKGRKLLDALLPGAGDDETAISTAMDKLHRMPNGDKRQN